MLEITDKWKTKRSKHALTVTLFLCHRNTFEETLQKNGDTVKLKRDPPKAVRLSFQGKRPDFTYFITSIHAKYPTHKDTAETQTSMQIQKWHWTWVHKHTIIFRIVLRIVPSLPLCGVCCFYLFVCLFPDFISSPYASLDQNGNIEILKMTQKNKKWSDTLNTHGKKNLANVFPNVYHAVLTVLDVRPPSVLLKVLQVRKLFGCDCTLPGNAEAKATAG